LHGKPLSVSCERFARILGFGEDDLGRQKIHGGETHLTVRWHSCLTLLMARLSLVLLMV
jgi:hypothetical protein